MAETKVGGEISLVGFDVLNHMELAVIKKIAGNYVRRLSDQTNYRSLRLELKIHKKGKSFMHEINAQALVNSRIVGAKSTEWNLYACLTALLDKILAEALHKKRSAKQLGEQERNLAAEENEEELASEPDQEEWRQEKKIKKKQTAVLE